MRIIFGILAIIGFATALVMFGCAVWFTKHLVTGWNLGYDYQKDHIGGISVLFFLGFYALYLTALALEDKKDYNDGF